MKKILPLITVFLLLLTPSVLAQEITTTASPPRLELEAQPGNTLQETLKVTNSSNLPQTYQIVATDFIVNDDQGTPVAVSQTTSGRWSLASWLTTNPPTITVEPNQSALVTLIAAVPQDALAGGHYAMVTFQPTTPDNLNLTGSAIASRVGSLIYLKVQGDITEAVYLKDFSVAKKWFEYGPIDIHSEIENLGDIHLKPVGSITVTNLLNQPVLQEKLEAVNIFPFASRTHTTKLPHKYYLGRYKAELNAFAGASTTPITGLFYFWVIPYKEISAILGAILVIVILLIIKSKKKSPPPPSPETIPAETPETTPPTA